MSVDALFAVDPQSLLLVTDFDGTLAPIVPFPAQARAVPGALESLERLSQRVGAVVLLTGRSRPSLMTALGEQVPTGVRILCNYGADDPQYSPPNDLHVIGTLLEQISQCAAKLPEGVMIEEKGLSVALHTRGCDQPGDAMSDIGVALGPIAHRLGLDMQHGRDVVDIGIRFGGKAAAVARLLNEREWSAAMMFGDDHSDLDAFDVLRDAPLRTLTVGVLSVEVPGVAARSDVVVDGPQAVAEILLKLIQGFEYPSAPQSGRRPG